MNKDLKLAILLFLQFIGVTNGLAYHYIVMPFYGGKLFHCIVVSLLFNTAFYLVFVYAYQMYQANRQLSKSVYTDALTGLNNRKAFEVAIKNIVKDDYSVIFIDIDDFSRFNNQYGHDVGDEVLRRVGSTITKCIADRGKAYRYGGEEIVVLLHSCSKPMAKLVAEQIRSTVSSVRIKSYPPVYVSIGVASYPQDGETVEKVIRLSDLALLSAKANGKNRVVVYSNVS